MQKKDLPFEMNGAKMRMAQSAHMFATHVLRAMPIPLLHRPQNNNDHDGDVTMASGTE